MNETSRPPDGLTSIIVPCFNQIDYTRHCIRSLTRHTRRPWELIVVDNGSSDGTRTYVEGVSDVASFPTTLIVNADNRGFPAAVNQGLAVARGAYVVLLNNDAVVTDCWLDQLIALADSNPSIGLTGPMSNYASPPQLVADVPYHNLEEMHEFAYVWRDSHRGKWFETEKLSGFCLLIKRRVIEMVGGLDEQFGLGLFDDDDFCRRARSVGFLPCVANDLFVHHFGSRTFTGSAIDTDSLLEANRARFSEKWGDDLGSASRVALTPWTGFGDLLSTAPPSIGKSLPPKQDRTCRISLTMIVRNEETNLPRCLASVDGVFDEIIIVDTGSTDRTIEIARSFGARVFDFVWVDDFAAARNAALARATGDYAFWLDADDLIDPPQQAKLCRLLAGLVPGQDTSHVVRCSCDSGPDGDGGQTVVDHVRLFPIREDVRWAYRVHEQILPSLRRAGIPVRWTDLIVRHTGYTDAALRSRKLERDLAILNAEASERPNDPFVLFNLGAIAVERGEWRSAMSYLRRSLIRSAPTDSITRKLHALIARSHQMLGEPEAALTACRSGLAENPDDAELLFRKAVIHRQLGDAEESESCWRRVLTLRRPEQFSSIDQGIYGHLTRRNLAALAQERGDRDEEIRLWTAVLAECPDDREALDHLANPIALPERRDQKSLGTSVYWLIPGSRRSVVPACGEGDFDPYVALAASWVERLQARVIVELGVRLGVSTRAFLSGARAADGHVWGVDLLDRHGIKDSRFTFLEADAAEVADRWTAIDLLHIDTDPHTEEQTSRWFSLYAAKCRAIALHDTHHPDFGVGEAVRKFVATRADEWDVHEYWGNHSGWTVLTRRVDPVVVSKELS